MSLDGIILGISVTIFVIITEYHLSRCCYKEQQFKSCSWLSLLARIARICIVISSTIMASPSSSSSVYAPPTFLTSSLLTLSPLPSSSSPPSSSAAGRKTKFAFWLSKPGIYSESLHPRYANSVNPINLKPQTGRNKS